MTRKARRLPVLILLLAIGSVFDAPLDVGGPSRGEPGGELEVRLQILDVTPSNSSEDSAMARIEVALSTFVPVSDPRLVVRRHDGSVWTTRAGAMANQATPWTESIERRQGGRGRFSLGSGEEARTIVEVPLEGRAIHEVIVTVSAEAPAGPLGTENAIRVPFGVPLPLPVDDGEVSEFRAVQAREPGP